MNKKMGIALIIIGFGIFATGIYLTFLQNKPSETATLNETTSSLSAKPDTLAALGTEPSEKETKTTDSTSSEQALGTEKTLKNTDFKESEEKGRKFEEYVVLKLNKKYFSVKEWRSDKYVKGVYAESNVYPDMEIAFSHKDIQEMFAIECKWRKSFYKNGLEWANEKQLETYQKFQKDKNMPVFIALGVGGESDAPEKLFIVPLSVIQGTFLSVEVLKPYQKLPLDKNLFFDTKDKILK